MKPITNTLARITTLLTPSQVHAQEFKIAVPEPQGFAIQDVGLLISRAIGVALLLAGVLVFVYLVWGGILMDYFRRRQSKNRRSQSSNHLGTHRTCHSSQCLGSHCNLSPTSSE